jgi:hypothetical protein
VYFGDDPMSNSENSDRKKRTRRKGGHERVAAAIDKFYRYRLFARTQQMSLPTVEVRRGASGNLRERLSSDEASLNDSYRNQRLHRVLPQASSASRLTDGAAGFLVLSQCSNRPER